ncbi:hypothetical protein ES703_70862 [subsurface metagenome]
MTAETAGDEGKTTAKSASTRHTGIPILISFFFILDTPSNASLEIIPDSILMSLSPRLKYLYLFVFVFSYSSNRDKK